MSSGLVPEDQIGTCEQLLASRRAQETPESRALRMAFGPKSPLPAVAELFYTMGGCWNLALALHERTGLPIELYYRDGRPRHAYVVDGAMAIDARGRDQLRLVRLGAAKTEPVSPDGLHELLDAISDAGDATSAQIVRQPAWIEAAGRAADVILSNYS